jgi:hypothetical protein
VDWEPEDSSRLFAIDLDSAAFMIFGQEPYGLAWGPDRGVRRLSVANV